MNADRVTLAPGYTISRIIKGGWQLAGGHGAVDRQRAVEDMFAFADAGITTFDCADIYTGVESLIGDFLRRYRAERGEDAARQVHVHTKCVPDLSSLGTLSPPALERLIDRSRARLGVETLDLVQFHWWDYRVPGAADALHALDRLRLAGKIRHLGVTNFDTMHLTALLDAGLPIVSHQVQYSLLDRRPARTLAELCRQRGVALLAFGALAGGFLSERWLDTEPPVEPLENRSLVKYRLIIEAGGGWGFFQRLLRVLREVAQRHASSIGAVAIRWTLDQPGVAAVIVGARHAGHLDATRLALSLRLGASDRRLIDDVLRDARGPSGDVYELERDRDGPHGRIMRYNLNTG